MAAKKKSKWWMPARAVECQQCGAFIGDYLDPKESDSCPKCGWTNAQQAKFDKEHP